jgi:tRNA (cmo5U34)-methyltransferase
MNQQEIRELFDQQAANYDTQWSKTQALRDCLYMLVNAAFADLPAAARLICVGAGTAAEILYFAAKNPGWQFTVVEPSAAMLDQCRQNAERAGLMERCRFHQGYLESLEAGDQFDAATCFLVSQFILDQQQRIAFFQQILQRLKPGATLASTDLAADVQSAEYGLLLRDWMNLMAVADLSEKAMARMRNAYEKEVGVIPAVQVEGLLRSAGFHSSLQFFQAGLIHGWLSRRAH